MGKAEPAKEPDFYNLIAHERGAPPDWRWFSVQAHGENREHGAVVVRGAVCTATYTRGPRKGQTNWTKMDHSTVREFVITFADYDARAAKWRAGNG